MEHTSKCNLREIRIGNDIAVTWAVMHNGEALPLDDRDIELVVHTPYNCFRIKDYTIDGNVIHWTFLGRDQQYTGDYMLTLFENKGGVEMAVIDTGLFRLVPTMFNKNGLTEPEGIILETGYITISSSAMIGRATEENDGLMPNEDKYMANQYRAALEELTDEEISSWFDEDSEE